MLALHASTAEIAAGAVIAGIGSATCNIFFNATIQRQVAVEMQARVAAFDTVGAFSVGPISLAAAGPISELIGAHTVLAFGAAWSLASSLLVLSLPTVRKIHWTTSDQESATTPREAIG